MDHIIPSKFDLNTFQPVFHQIHYIMHKAVIRAFIKSIAINIISQKPLLFEE